MQKPERVRSKTNLEFEMIQWQGNNEAAVRQFVANDNNIHFDGGVLQVWNEHVESWMNVPVWNWIMKGSYGELNSISDKVKIRLYESVNTNPILEREPQSQDPQS